jgi:uncharacterized membrane protein
MNDGSFGFNGDSWVFVASLLFFAVMALVVLRFARQFREDARSEFVSTEPTEDPAMQMLNAQYERGEIDLETYQRRRTELDLR